MMCLICGIRVHQSQATVISCPPEDSSYIQYLKLCLIQDAFPKHCVSYICTICTKEIFRISEILKIIHNRKLKQSFEQQEGAEKTKCFLCGYFEDTCAIKISEIDSKRIVINKLLGISHSTFGYILACKLCYNVVYDLHNIHENVFKTAMRIGK